MAERLLHFFSKLVFWIHLKSILKSLWPFLGFSHSSAYPLAPNFLQVNLPTFQIWIRYLVFFFFFNFILCNFTILYWFCRISKWICHRYICVLLCNWPAIHSAPWYLFPQELTMKYKCLPSLPEAFQPSSPLNLFSCHVPRWQLETDGFNILAAFQSYWKRENK